jgi:phosphoglycerol transferase MdoB-like AlkP superfamily enzyme
MLSAIFFIEDLFWENFQRQLLLKGKDVQDSYRIPALFWGMMTVLYSKLTANRFGLLWVLILLVVAISFITRLILLLNSYSSFDFTFINIVGVGVIGFFFDLVNATYFTLPLLLFLWLMPERFYQKKGHHFFLYGLFHLFIFLLLFNAVAEGFFWDEFSTRFNFIAVDYLVYTTEVIGNIRQSYPIELIIACLLLLSAAITYALKPFINTVRHSPMSLRKRTHWFIGYASLSCLSFMLVNTKLHHFSSNTYANELAGNGLYELFAAYRNNELDYDQFYPLINEDKADLNMHNFIQTSHDAFFQPNSSTIQRQVTHSGQDKNMNVVLISVESLSAEFMESFGNTKKITPFLDSLAKQSLLFTNLYATGTRTVRGLEALSLSVPPTPGQSIVRRPDNEHLFTLASVFNAKGYESKFIYGGYGYFDNMGYFFENNGYEVIDRSALSDDEIDYENIWGVADENLFTLALREIEKTTAQNNRVFTHIMTTSNHRPYTYPEGRIDIPSHTGREGAVKYTDYAVDKFIRQASKTSWYPNTVFVIVADHCASSAGKTQLPVNKYHIPMIIFSPGRIQPGTQDRLMSQIDVAPTLLGLLNFSYTSKFFGYDIYALPPGHERAFVSTYQLLGYLKNDSLVVLSPNKAAEVYLTGKNHEVVSKVLPQSSTSPVRVEAISWYQTASHAFKNGALKY